MGSVVAFVKKNSRKIQPNMLQNDHSEKETSYREQKQAYPTHYSFCGTIFGNRNREQLLQQESFHGNESSGF